jgi:threonine aldolase
MGNLIGVLVNTQPGQEVILDERSHLFLMEVGSVARVAGCVTHTVPSHRGWLDPAEVEAAIRSPAREAPTTGLICVENTSNRGGGAVIPPAHLAKLSHVAKKHGLPIHMDGARFFNAVVASGQPAENFTQYVDTLALCLSKGLGAPFGALICGSEAHIEQAIRDRQLLGGGMRQAGVMAAAGIVALETGIDRLAEDHANAKKLALGLAERFPGCCDPDSVETNLIYFTLASLGASGQELSDYLAKEGIITFPREPRMRFVTHRMITSEDIDTVLNAFDRWRTTA